jgi:hypothetical protein
LYEHVAERQPLSDRQVPGSARRVLRARDADARAFRQRNRSSEGGSLFPETGRTKKRRKKTKSERFREVLAPRAKQTRLAISSGVQRTKRSASTD